MIGQTRGPDGTETEAGTGTGIKGAMKAATKSELHASREDREITERTEIEDVMTVTWATRDLLMDVEAGASLAPELCLAQGQDHLAASPTESATARTHRDVVPGALR